MTSDDHFLRKERGEVCSRCGVEFDGAHGKPVLCYTCHPIGASIGGPFYLPKAWLEEKAK